eukprot:SM000073S21477  [mRNA]  locus=s73:577264:579553:+ [translate_table: standard]
MAAAVHETEDLARLVLTSARHRALLLHMEALLVSILGDHNSRQEELALSPLPPYERMLVHRLCDLFRLGHASSGVGDERHIVVTVEPHSAPPDKLLCDVFEEHHDDGGVDIASRQILRQETTESSRDLSSTSGMQGGAEVAAHLLSGDTSRSLQVPWKDQEQQCLAAYFSRVADEEFETLRNRSRAADQAWEIPADTTPGLRGEWQSKSPPMAARRMIAHALGRPDIVHREVVPDSTAELDAGRAAIPEHVWQQDDLVLGIVHLELPAAPSPTSPAVSTSIGVAPSATLEEARRKTQPATRAARKLFMQALGVSQDCQAVQRSHNDLAARLAAASRENLELAGDAQLEGGGCGEGVPATEADKVPREEPVDAFDPADRARQDNSGAVLELVTSARKRRPSSSASAQQLIAKALGITSLHQTQWPGCSEARVQQILSNDNQIEGAGSLAATAPLSTESSATSRASTGNTDEETGETFLLTEQHTLLHSLQI